MKKLIVVALCMLVSSVYAGSKKIILTENNSLSINKEFRSKVTANIAQKALELDSRLESGEPIYLIVDSPGGSIEAGINLINVLKKLNRPVHTVTLFAASMGFQTVQGLGNRYILSNGTLMSHKARGGFYGEFPGQLDSRYGFWLTRVFSLDKIAAKRSGMSLKKYHALIENEYWCQGQQCVDKGFADKVVEVSCDKSLTGTYEEVFARQFAITGEGVKKLEIIDVFSKCPAISGELDWFVTINGQTLEEIENYQERPEQINEIVKQKEQQIENRLNKIVIKY